MKRFSLNREDPTHLLSARAYVWGKNMAPLVFFSVPFSGPANENVAQAIGRFERDNPGTLGLATRGDRNAMRAVRAVVDAALASGGGVFAPVAVERRASKVDPALSTYSFRARAAVNLKQGNRSWVAHHLLTFSGVAKLPLTTQQAMVAAGWKLDRPENLMALPANLAAWIAPPNFGLNLPYHSGNHPLYNARVDAALARIAAVKAAGKTLMALLVTEEKTLRSYIISVARQGRLQ
ncbi:AHH domain-containing protein [Sphingomonas sp. ac-8]|uniref:AHH domain-containing protein n=1 Tax=Sphingomonas sp. ac-8 TaxID=3242977 RepID=UPI003A7F9CA5